MTTSVQDGLQRQLLDPDDDYANVITIKKKKMKEDMQVNVNKCDPKNKNSPKSKKHTATKQMARLLSSGPPNVDN